MKLADITGRWIDQPFESYGCIKFAYLFLKDLGFNPPESIGHWNIYNYTTLVTADIAVAQRVMVKSFLKIGDKAPAGTPAIGDLLVVRQPAGACFPAVYVGAGQAIASFIKKGVQVFKIDPKNEIIIARRL